MPTRFYLAGPGVTPDSRLQGGLERRGSLFPCDFIMRSRPLVVRSPIEQSEGRQMNPEESQECRMGPGIRDTVCEGAIPPGPWPMAGRMNWTAPSTGLSKVKAQASRPVRELYDITAYPPYVSGRTGAPERGGRVGDVRRRVRRSSEPKGVRESPQALGGSELGGRGGLEATHYDLGAECFLWFSWKMCTPQSKKRCTVVFFQKIIPQSNGFKMFLRCTVPS